jgi:hypothetical protein
VTLVEFVAPLANAPHRDKCLSILYFQHRYENVQSLTVDELRLSLQRARIPRWAKINVADVLAKAGSFVDSPGTKGDRRLWTLTKSGEQYVRSLLGLPQAEPEIEHDTSFLIDLASGITNVEVRAYIEESIKCLQVNALRASVVFLWTGAVRLLQESMLSIGPPKLNPAISKHDPKARHVSKLDDFAYIKDKVMLLAAQELGLLDKGQRETLEEALNLRNRCGHPTRYRPGTKKVSSFIEDITGIVFS